MEKKYYIGGNEIVIGKEYVKINDFKYNIPKYMGDNVKVYVDKYGGIYFNGFKLNYETGKFKCSTFSSYVKYIKHLIYV